MGRSSEEISSSFTIFVSCAPSGTEGAVMKKVFGFALTLVALAFLPMQSATAQQFSWSLGGPRTNFTVQNGTDDGTALIVNIGHGKNIPLLAKVSRTTSSFGPFNRQGDVPIFINACSSIDDAFRF